jgi:hypothetical protein
VNLVWARWFALSGICIGVYLEVSV